MKIFSFGRPLKLILRRFMNWLNMFMRHSAGRIFTEIPIRCLLTCMKA